MLAASPPAAGAPQRYSPLHQLKTSRSNVQRALLREALAWLHALGVEGAPAELLPDAGQLFADCWLLGRAADAVQAVRRGQLGAARPAPAPQLGADGQRLRTFRDRLNDYARLQQLLRELGMRSDLLPPLADVEQGQAAAAVAACFWELAEECTALGLAVPAFGDTRSSLRHSMSREANARRAELFAGDGSPPKRPAINPLLTPRAFTGKDGASLLRDSQGNMREWLRRSSSRKAEAHLHGEEGVEDGELIASSRGGLGHTIAALERASAEAMQRQDSSKRSGVPAQQPWRRPVLPRLDVEAAMAQAAAEASECSSAAVPAWDDQDVSPSTGNSSPLTSSLASPAAAGAGYASSSVLSSPECRGSASPCRPPLPPGHLAASRYENPLWSQSPQPPSRGAAYSPAAMAGLAGPLGAYNGHGWRSPGHAATPASSTTTPVHAGMGSPVQAFQAPGGSGGRGGRVRGSGGDLQESFDSVEGDSSLLESLLSPPNLKPAHTRLLGQLMHTAALPTSAAAKAGLSGSAGAAAGEAAAREVVQPWRMHAEPSQVEEAIPPVEHTVEAGPSCPMPSQAATAQQSSNGNAGGSTARRLAMVAVSAVAGLVAAVAAGAAQQQHSARRQRLLHAQPVPSMCSARRRHVHSDQRKPCEAAPISQGQGAAAGTAGGYVASTGWDNPHALLTRG